MKPYKFIFIVFCLTMPVVFTGYAQSGSPSHALLAEKVNSGSNITILWTSGDRNVFVESVKPYCENCFTNNVHEKLALMAWGPSVCLLAEDEDLQKELETLIKKGLDVKASHRLTEKYGCTERLEEMGAEIVNINDLLSEFLKKRTTRLVSL